MTEHKSQFVAISFDDGGVGIMQFILDPRLPEGTVLPGWDGEKRAATDEAIQYEIDKSAWGERTVVEWRRIKQEDVPTDRTFRNAWHDEGKGQGKGIKVEMGRAREMHKDRLREERAPLLAQLDVEYQRADEAGATGAKKEIAARKQVLRDVPADPRIEQAKTPEELKQISIKV